MEVITTEPTEAARAAEQFSLCVLCGYKKFKRAIRFIFLWLLFACLPLYAENAFLVESQECQKRGDETKALELFEKSAVTSSDPQEIYVSRLNMAKLQQKLNRPSKEIEENYELAYAS